VLHSTEVLTLNTNKRILTDNRRNGFIYEKLLLATGATPKKLDIPGGDLEEIRYYRTLDDYAFVNDRISKGTSVLIIGGGFIGTEMAAAICSKEAQVTMLYDETHLMGHPFPESLCNAIEESYTSKGVKLIKNDSPSSFEKRDDGMIITSTNDGLSLESDIVIVGIGITPETKLAESAGLAIEDGIRVDKKLQTSARNVFAAGDAVCFPYGGAKEMRRVDHWDNALHQGRTVGLNMLGKNMDYDYMPQFSSNLFGLNYEAVGDIDSSLEIFADWKVENHTGVLYYMKENRVRGVAVINIADKMENARKMLRSGKNIKTEDLKGAI
jgi:NADPH-dependent 2,4-dienoyl-CoA reductase/sulfur reductase-like enzyme